jgi:hypothetical protein
MNVQKAFKMNAFGISRIFVWVWVFHRLLFIISYIIIDGSFKIVYFF